MYPKYFKRPVDFISALCGLIILLPALVVISILLFLGTGGNPFFVQKRVGLHGTFFNIIKLKTMSDKRDKFGVLLPDEMRLTKIGAFVRRFSLDEIPQLINVFKGDMSLIGPRPLLPEYLPLYNQFQMRRHELRPGITGWAQINGRNNVSWPKKFELDVWYVDHISLRLDCRILLSTIAKVFKSEGVSQDGHVTMPPFKGNEI